MNKSVNYFFSIFCLSFVSIFGSTVTTENKMFLSQLDQEYIDDENSTEWVIFVKQIVESGSDAPEQLTLSFPHTPTLSVLQNENSLYLQYEASNEEANFSLMIEDVTEAEIDKYLVSVEKELSPLYIKNFTQVDSPYGKCFEIEYADSINEKIHWKKKIHFYKGKCFTLQVKSSTPSDTFAHFFSSFEIIYPLK